MMIINKFSIFFIFSLYLTLFLCSPVNAKEGHPKSISSLEQTIVEQDKLLYDAIFNSQDEEYLKDLFEVDLEFYHDKGGLMFKSGEAFLNGWLRIWALQETGKKNWQRRELLSTEVYPLNNYGALQIGTHRFYETRPDGIEFAMDDAKFVHLWKVKDKKWKLARIVSYDHQPITTPPLEITEETVLKLKGWMQELNVPAVGIGLINDGKTTYSKVFGNQSEGVKASSNTIFKVASITKPVSALVTLKMVDQGLWDLDEPLANYWTDPDVVNDPRNKKLTTRHVLNQLSGLPNWRFLTDSGKLNFLFDPGEKFEYSGEGFEYLKKAVEHKFSRPFESIAHKVLFNKAEMNNTKFWWDETVEQSMYAENFNEDGKQYKTEKYYKALAAGNILSTTDDYLKFGEHVLAGAGLEPELFAEIQKPHSSMIDDLLTYGYGWMNLKLSNGNHVIYHDGRDPGVRTIIIFIPSTNQGIVILTNGDNGDLLYRKLLSELSPLTADFVSQFNKAVEIYLARQKQSEHN
ncbi:serine hydrolase [Kangiella marina]|uniref:Beta-lactamase-related domain-containing protein n=1 Tax=Kangiella marina TaxID=1079178 RepID=A0ABP8IFD7_9GAMM